MWRWGSLWRKDFGIGKWASGGWKENMPKTRGVCGGSGACPGRRPFSPNTQQITSTEVPWFDTQIKQTQHHGLLQGREFKKVYCIFYLLCVLVFVWLLTWESGVETTTCNSFLKINKNNTAESSIITKTTLALTIETYVCVSRVHTNHIMSLHKPLRWEVLIMPWKPPATNS